MNTTLHTNPDCHRDVQPVAVIEVRNDFACVSQPGVDVLRPLLERHQTHFVPDKSGCLVPVRVPLPFFSMDDVGRMVIPAGLVDRAIQHLQRHGYAVEVEDYSRWSQFDRIDQQWLESTWFSPGQQDLLQACCGRPCGQILVQGNEDAVDDIVLLLRLHPAASTCIVAKNMKEANRLAHRLELTGFQVVVGGRDELWKMPTKLLVAPFTLASSCRAEDFDMMIFNGAESAISSAVRMSQIWKSDGMFRYAIVQPGQRLDMTTRLWLEVVAGPVIYRDETAPQWSRVTVTRVGPFPAPAQDKWDSLQRKCSNIWHNAVRNRVVAQIAQAAADGDMAVLRNYGVLADEIGSESLFAKSKPTVAVLVEVVEHGRELLRLLRGFKLYDGLHGPTNDEQACLPLVPNRAVITMARAHRHSVQADIVVRADGTGSTWGRDYEPQYDSGPEMLVIEVLDDFDDQARRDARRRCRDYEARGWAVVGSNERTA